MTNGGSTRSGRILQPTEIKDFNVTFQIFSTGIAPAQSPIQQRLYGAPAHVHTQTPILNPRLRLGYADSQLPLQKRCSALTLLVGPLDP